jgi:hypothetical protein
MVSMGSFRFFSFRLRQHLQQQYTKQHRLSLILMRLVRAAHIFERHKQIMIPIVIKTNATPPAINDGIR